MEIHLFICFVLFFIGTYGIVISRKNLILTFMSLEILILASNIMLVMLSVYFDDLVAQVFVFYILSIAAAETAIGLSLLVSYYKLYTVF